MSTQDPNSAPEPSPDLGLGGNSDLAFTGSVQDVLHPGRTARQDEPATEESLLSLESARASDLLFGDLEKAAQSRQAVEPISTAEEEQEGPLLET